MKGCGKLLQDFTVFYLFSHYKISKWSTYKSGLTPLWEPTLELSDLYRNLPHPEGMKH